MFAAAVSAITAQSPFSILSGMIIARDEDRISVLKMNEYPCIRKWSENYSPVDFVYDHRYEIAYLYEIFIQWSETQMECYDCDDRMFNIYFRAVRLEKTIPFNV